MTTPATATATATATRTFAVDKAHSEAVFQVRHLVTKVRGGFSDFDGTIAYDEAQPKNSSVTFTVQTASIDTNNADRDAHLRSADFFLVEKYPTITFVSAAIAPDGREPLHRDRRPDHPRRHEADRPPRELPREGQGPVGQREDRVRDRSHHQPQGLRPHLERGRSRRAASSSATR